MVNEKYFVRFLDLDETEVVSYDDLLEVITDISKWPLRVVPLDENGELDHLSEFLVGDSCSLSFLFNDKNI